MSEFPGLRVRRDGAVAQVFIDRPARRNAIDLALWRAIPLALAELGVDEAVRVILLAGAPGLPFCSGADISEFSSVRARPEDAAAYEATNAGAFDAIAGLGKPVIAVIDGFCLGGGLGLALACDMRVASPTAVFGVPAARLGLGYPPAAIAYVTAAVGAARARDLFFTARRVDAREALDIGLIDRLADDGALFETALTLAATIAANAPLTIRAARAAIARAAGLPGAPDPGACEALARACLDSADYAEGREAFLAKRAPTFRGR